MEIPVLRSHLQTTNIYVQRQITRDNISQLRNYMASEYYQSLYYLKREELKRTLLYLTSLAVKLDRKIEKNEQGSFPFQS